MNMNFKSTSVKNNRRIEIEKHFQVNNISFSDNERFIIVVGEKVLHVFDTRDSRSTYKLTLPNPKRRKA